MVPLVVVVAMTAAVSAYESHAINVTARVSNAITVSHTDTTLGTDVSPFAPLRWEKIALVISLSNSFIGQSRVNTVNYKVCAAPKPNTYDPALPESQSFEFLWMGAASFIEIDPPSPDTGPFWWIGPTTLLLDNTLLFRGITPPASGVVCPAGAVDSLTHPGDDTDTIYLWEDVPTFVDTYNTSAEDAFNKPRNDLADCGDPSPALTERTDNQPCVILPVPPANSDEGTQLGLDLIIQVIDIQLIP